MPPAWIASSPPRARAQHAAGATESAATAPSASERPPSTYSARCRDRRARAIQSKTARRSGGGSRGRARLAREAGDRSRAAEIPPRHFSTTARSSDWSRRVADAIAAKPALARSRRADRRSPLPRHALTRARELALALPSNQVGLRRGRARLNNVAQLGHKRGAITVFSSAAAMPSTVACTHRLQGRGCDVRVGADSSAACCVRARGVVDPHVTAVAAAQGHVAAALVVLQDRAPSFPTRDGRMVVEAECFIHRSAFVPPTSRRSRPILHAGT